MAATAPTAKTRMLELLQGQPDDSSYEELLRELAFLRMVERGLSDADAGRLVSDEELGREIETWGS
jgi:predicted transcriptional regulator